MLDHRIDHQAGGLAQQARTVHVLGQHLGKGWNLPFVQVCCAIPQARGQQFWAVLEAIALDVHDGSDPRWLAVDCQWGEQVRVVVQPGAPGHG
ncbi:hypothetical protein D9M71_337440 [compost metagenome]